nr:hypothetical protein [Tanacetum cinerariifolium]
MNYQLVVVGNQPNDNAGIKENLDACKVRKETVSAQQYVLLPLWSTGSQDPHNIIDDVADAAFDVIKNENDVHVFANGSDRTDNKKHDEKAKRDDKGKSPVDSPTGVRGHTHEEGIDYDEVFAHVARIEAIRLFLAYASFMGFKDLDYPNKVYKVVKALYGLHQALRAWYETLANYLLENSFQRGKIDQTLFINKQKGLQVKQKDDRIFISQDKYVAKILRKFGFTDVKSASNPIGTEKPLLKDPDGEDVDVHLYRSMIGSLMYLTSSRPDIMFAICACARFQVTPKVSYLHAVKRIFRYLKGKPHLGLWYPGDSPFNFVAYSNSNYVRASLDRKSSTGGCQFLYASEGFDQIMDFLNAHTIQYALMVNHTIYVSCIKQFWATTTVKKVNDVVQLRALIDGKKVVVSEAIIRRDLHLDDADGVECLPNEEIFKELARMGYEKPPQKLTFYKAFFFAQWKFLIHTLVQCLSAKRTAWNEFNCSMTSVVICLATGRKFNFSKYIFDSIVRNVDSPSKFLMYPRFLQVAMDHQVDDMTSHNTRYISPALTQKVFANMRRVGKGFSGVKTPLFASMLVQPQPQAEEEVELKKRVKKLEKKKKSKSTGFKRLRKFGGKIAAIDADDGINLVDMETDKEVVAMDDETQGRLNQKGVSVAKPTVFDDEDVTMTMAQTLIKLKAEKAKLLDEQIAQKLHDEEVQKAAARDKQEKADIKRALELQEQYDDKEKNIDWSVVAEKAQELHLDSIRKYQNLKKKPVSIAQARKNMIIYLKNTTGYKMEFFKGMTYDKVRPIFKREYKKVQTLFKPDKDVQEPKTKRVADETLLRESFKKLRAAKVSGSESTQKIPSNDPKEMAEEDVHNMLEIVPVSEFKVEALQVKYPIIDWEIHTEGFDREDTVALWNLVKEKFSPAVSSEDNEKAL